MQLNRGLRFLTLLTSVKIFLICTYNVLGHLVAKLCFHRHHFATALVMLRTVPKWCLLEQITGSPFRWLILIRKKSFWGKIKFQLLNWPIYKPEWIYAKWRGLWKSRQCNVRLRNQLTTCYTAGRHGTGDVSQTRYSYGKTHISPCALLDEQVLSATHWRSQPSLPSLFSFRPEIPPGIRSSLGVRICAVLGCQPWVDVLLVRFTCLKHCLCNHPRAWLWMHSGWKLEKEVQ